MVMITAIILCLIWLNKEGKGTAIHICIYLMCRIKKKKRMTFTLLFLFLFLLAIFIHLFMQWLTYLQAFTILTTSCDKNYSAYLNDQIKTIHRIWTSDQTKTIHRIRTNDNWRRTAERIWTSVQRLLAQQVRSQMPSASHLGWFVTFERGSSCLRCEYQSREPCLTRAWLVIPSRLPFDIREFSHVGEDFLTHIRKYLVFYWKDAGKRAALGEGGLIEKGLLPNQNRRRQSTRMLNGNEAVFKL